MTKTMTPARATPTPHAGPSPERRALSREIRERLSEAMTTLSPRQRTIFLLKHFEELSIPEIAEVMSLDIGTIKSHLFRAAHKMRERLAEFQSGDSPQKV